MVKMNVKITGVPETKAMLGKVEHILSHMKPALSSVGDYLLQVFGRDVFETEGAIYGKSWAALDPRYSLGKSQTYPGRGILERTGRLRHGFKALATETYLLVSNPTPYGKYHQGGRGVPQRIIVALERKQRSEIEDILRDDIVSRLRKVI